MLRCTGVQSEYELPFAALHQLVRPCLSLVEHLPTPQAAALRGAFGISFDRADDGFLSSLALLSLLAEAASRRPLLCLIDDAQWLDRSSADALGFRGSASACRADRDADRGARGRGAAVRGAGLRR